MYTFKSLPLPPSANELHDPTHRTVWRKDKSGKAHKAKAFGKKNSPAYKAFLNHCELISRQIHVRNPESFKDLHQAIADKYVFDITFYFCMTKDRIFNEDGYAKSLDVDNRLKPMLDGFKKIIRIDDKYAFKVATEKISVEKKELECTIAVLKLTKPRTIQQILSTL